jgi:hypothetical protein
MSIPESPCTPSRLLQKIQGAQQEEQKVALDMKEIKGLKYDLGNKLKSPEMKPLIPLNIINPVLKNTNLMTPSLKSIGI